MGPLAPLSCSVAAQSMPGTSNRCLAGPMGSCGRRVGLPRVPAGPASHRRISWLAAPPINTAAWALTDRRLCAEEPSHISVRASSGAFTSSSSSSSSSSAMAVPALPPLAPHGGAVRAMPRSSTVAAAAKAGKGSGSDKGSGGGGSGGSAPKGSGGSSSGGSSSGKGKGKGAADDKADPNKADFSAYWSLRFREFFSGRRQYLEMARKRKEAPEAVQRVDAQIAETRRKLDETIQQERDAARAREQLEIDAEALAIAELATPEEREKHLQEVAKGLGPPTTRDRIDENIDGARAQLSKPSVRIAAVATLQLRSALRALATAPIALPAAALAAWRGIFAQQRYQQFLMAEGERVWYWRNRTENERWFWEIFFMDRFFIPVGFTLAYLYLVPNNLIWAVVVPFVVLFWQDGRLPTPMNLEWWLIMVFGFYGKCWPQVTAIFGALLGWW